MGGSPVSRKVQGQVGGPQCPYGQRKTPFFILPSSFLPSLSPSPSLLPSFPPSLFPALPPSLPHLLLGIGGGAAVLEGNELLLAFLLTLCSGLGPEEVGVGSMGRSAMLVTSTVEQVALLLVASSNHV